MALGGWFSLLLELGDGVVEFWGLRGSFGEEVKIVGGVELPGRGDCEWGSLWRGLDDSMVEDAETLSSHAWTLDFGLEVLCGWWTGRMSGTP